MDHQLHSADAHRAEFEATDVQNVESDLVTLADFAEQILDRRLRVSEHQRRRARTLDAHLVFFRARRQPVLPLDDERRELVAIDLREHDEDVGKAAVGDEHLLAVENVVRAVVAQPRGRFRGHCVGTGACFGQRVSGDQFAGGNLRQILLLWPLRCRSK